MPLPKWVEWAVASATVSGVGLAALGVAYLQALAPYRSSLVVAGLGLFALGLVLPLIAGAWSLAARRRRQGHPLHLELFIDYLVHLTDLSGELVMAGYLGRRFAILRVRNEGARNLKDVVARCVLQSQEIEIRCVWSAAPGRRFDGEGSYAATLNAGDSRLLVFAQAFTEARLWSRLPESRPIYEVPARAQIGFYQIGRPQVTHFISRAGEILDFTDPSVELRLSFHAEGLERTQVHRIKLGFKGNEPTALLQ